MTGRTAWHKGADRARGGEFETQVGEWLGPWKYDQTASQEKLDFWLPGGLLVEAKGKYQPLSAKWQVAYGVPEQDLFVLDELSIRKGLAFFPSCYFVFGDIPTRRIFFARVDEVALAASVRVNRVGPTGHLKGKVLLDLTTFHLLEDPPNDLLPAIFADQLSMGWKKSECIGQKELVVL